jgi:integrase
MWLSFSMSEVRGLTKSKSISGDYLTIREVIVDVDGKPYKKDMAKNPTRNRKHRIPPYIKSLIDKVDGDALVPMSGRALYHRWIRCQDRYGMEHITFHDLRHLNASVMALLRIPDKYAQERGGWKSDKVMKGIYMQTFSEERERVDDIIDGYFLELCNTKCNTTAKNP